MASNKSYISYSKEAFYELSNVYTEGNANARLLEKLRELGARRVLFLLSEKINELRNFERLMASYEKFGFRCFTYARKSGVLKDTDIMEALSVYREFNCDTIVTLGGAFETDCGKLVSAMHTNGNKSPVEFSGVNNIKRDISLVCCIVTDNSPNSALPSAEFLDTSRNKLISCYSSYLIPQSSVFDSDICVRREISECIGGALISLCTAIESYMSPASVFAPEYKANAVLSIKNILQTLEKMVNAPDDSYQRTRLSCAGYYAGLSSTKTGIGYAHIIMHSLLERYGEIHGVMYIRFLSEVLRKSLDFKISDIAALARELHICNKSTDDEAASELLLNALDRLVDKYGQYGFVPMISDKDARKIAEEVRREASVFELRKITNETVLSIFASVAGAT